jgi:hypothetical protein
MREPLVVAVTGRQIRPDIRFDPGAAAGKYLSVHTG